MDWSEVTITFDRSDHPRKTHCRGKYPMFVNPLIDGYEFSKTLMDGGSSINILYIETLHRMKLHESQLSYSSVTFHGIVPGRQANSLGVTYQRAMQRLLSFLSKTSATKLCLLS